MRTSRWWDHCVGRPRSGDERASAEIAVSRFKAGNMKKHSSCSRRFWRSRTRDKPRMALINLAATDLRGGTHLPTVLRKPMW